MNKIGDSNGPTAFRAFQGWMSLSNSEPSTGTLKVLPLLKEPTAYILLRPFLSDVKENEMPGCVPSKTFQISHKWHPDLFNNLVSLPKLYPGDTVWWHPDLVQGLEDKHEGSEANSGFYIPAAPDCSTNRIYLRKLRHSFLLGQTPPDFPVNNYEMEFATRAKMGDLSNLGRKLMGWPLEDNVRTDDKQERCEHQIEEINFNAL